MPETATAKKRRLQLKPGSIQSKLILVIILILIPVVTLLTFFSYWNTKSLRETQVFELLEIIANNKQEQVTSIVNQHFELAKNIVGEADIVDNLSTDSARTRKLSQAVSAIFVTAKEDNPLLENLLLTDAEGLIIASASAWETGSQISREKYFTHALNHFGIQEELGELYVSGPLVKAEKIVGALILKINAKDIFSVLADYRGLGLTGEILLGKRDREQVIIINQTRYQESPEPLHIGVEKNPRIPLVLATQQLSGAIATKDYRNKSVYAVYRYLSLADWGLVVKMDDQEALAPIIFMRNEMIKVSALIMVLFVLVAYIVSRSITEPLHRLYVGTEKLAKGEWDHELNIHSGDEVEQLAAEFKRMAQQLKGLYLGLEQKVQDRTSQLQKEKEISEKLANDLKKFQLAVENASDQIIITDPEGYTLYANKIIEKITGYKTDEVIGKKAGLLWGNQMDKEFYRKLWKTIKEEKKTFEAELTNKRKNSEKYIAKISISPILDVNQQIRFFVGVERDITLEKEIDRMKTEFISIASHQLRTPLSAIKWFTEMVLAGDAGELQAEQKEYLQQVYESNERMIELVNSLLNVSRIEQGRIAIEPYPTDLKQLVNQVLSELQPRIKDKKLKVTLDIKDELPLVSIDPKLIRQVYANLLTNAVKYTQEGGEIRIEIYLKDQEVTSLVKDNGYGIPLHQQSRVFSKFFRADNIRNVAPDGSGLGLYIIKSVIESSQGKIWFESQEGKGTSFWFSLPLSGTPARKGERTLEVTKN